MMKKSAIALSALLITGSAGMQIQAAEFTADAVETRPGQQLRYGKLTVKDHLSRFEFQVRGNPVVQITDKAANITRFLSPLSHTYFEVKGTPDAAADGDFSNATPCPKVPGITCVKDREEQLGGFKVEKYRVSADKIKRSVYVWWDPKRKMALRREYLNGGVQQMIMHGVMPYDEGRKAENWEVLYMSPFGSYQRGSVQYDPDLGIAVMQNFPNGTSRSLNNIKVKTVDDALFAIPERYKKIDAPKPQGPFGRSRLESFSARPKAAAGKGAAFQANRPPAMPATPDWVKKAHKKAMEDMRKGAQFTPPKMPEWVKKANRKAMEDMRNGHQFKAPKTPEWVKKARKEAEARWKAQLKANGGHLPPWANQARSVAPDPRFAPRFANPVPGGYAPNAAPWGRYPGWGRRPNFRPAPYGYNYPPRPRAPFFNPVPPSGAQPAK